MNTSFQKTKIALRYTLIGLSQKDPQFNLTLRAMALAESCHVGVRKDNVTPEIQHQYEIALYLLTILPGHPRAAEIIAAALLHDAFEDYKLDLKIIEQKTSFDVSNSAWLMSKFDVDGKQKTPEQYFEQISQCPLSSIVKGADRINNLGSMLGVFTNEKQKQYIAETETYFLPMIKQARRRFPEQVLAYENIKMMMKSQLTLLKARLAAAA